MLHYFWLVKSTAASHNCFSLVEVRSHRRIHHTIERKPACGCTVGMNNTPHVCVCVCQWQSTSVPCLVHSTASSDEPYPSTSLDGLVRGGSLTASLTRFGCNHLPCGVTSEINYLRHKTLCIRRSYIWESRCLFSGILEEPCFTKKQAHYRPERIMFCSLTCKLVFCMYHI